jgi:Kef-type K+ transport system membrane component KefB
MNKYKLPNKLINTSCTNILLLTFFLLVFNTVGADSATHSPQSGFDPVIFLWLVIFIFLSRSMSFVKKIGLPLAVGEILTGIILGDLHFLNINIFATIEHNPVMRFLAELGAIILMFEIGLESKFSDLKKNFKRGIKLSIIGSIFTFAGGYSISWLLIKDSTVQLNILIGIICAATATGISVQTFKEMNLLPTKEVKIVLVASILDELISIICFSIISTMAISNVVNLFGLSLSIAKVCAFFIFAAVFGQWITPLIMKWSTKIHAGLNMKIGVLLVICFLFSWLAHTMGLAFIVGAFIAGLILDEVYFKAFSRSNFIHELRYIATQITDWELRNRLNHTILRQENNTLKELLRPISHLFVPIFFIYLGMMLNLKDLFELDTLLLTLALLIMSFLGRILSGYFIRGEINHLILGLGMTPIGEAGLIFAIFGKMAGILNQQVLSAVVSTLVIAAIITPVLIKFSIKKYGVHHE